MHSFALLFSTLVATSSVRGKYTTHCSTSDVSPNIPVNQTALVLPTSTSLRFATLGHGVQNYTCSNTSIWTSVGAVARLFDASCIPSSEYTTLSTLALQEATFPKPTSTRHRHIVDFTPSALIRSLRSLELDPAVTVPGFLGDHYFVIFNGTLHPKFDFKASQKEETAFVVASKEGSTASPTNASLNVPWLQLSAVDGALAKTVFRIDTAGGNPPNTSCPTLGQSLSVPYSAIYLFYL